MRAREGDDRRRWRMSSRLASVSPMDDVVTYFKDLQQEVLERFEQLDGRANSCVTPGRVPVAAKA